MLGASVKAKLAPLAVAGCTITAKDILTSATVATTTSGSDGTYSLTGLTSGTSYKVIAVCGGNSYSSVAKADTTAKANKSPEVTSPVSTVVAAMIMQAVLEAVESATASLSASVAATIKASVVAAMDSVITTLKSTIEEAIKSGSMEAPTVAEASAIASGISTATTSTAAASASAAYETAKPVPASVSQSVEGAKSQVSAFADCDATAGSESACTKAVAKIMYSGLNFGVVLKKVGGAFATEIAAGGCDTATLGTLFPNSDIQDDTPNAGACMIKPKMGRVDRNRGDERGGGDDGGMLFTEEGAITGKKGVLTAMGKALFNNYKYRLSNIDSMVFTYNATAEAGVNARAFFFLNGDGSSGSAGAPSFYTKNSGGTWTAVASTPWRDDRVSYCTSTDCNVLPTGDGGGHVNLKIPFDDGTIEWLPAAVDATHVTVGSAAVKSLVTSINGGSFTGFFKSMYGGPVPAMPQMDDFLNATAHIGNNPSGSKRFWAIYSEPIQHDPSATTNPCFDITSTEPCLGVSGAPYPVVRVNMTLAATPNATTKVRAITALTVSSTGSFIMRPYYNSTGFSGVVGFTKFADGTMGTDEMMGERALKIVSKSSDCTSLSGATACAVGKVYNVKLDWSSCSGGNGCPAYTLSAAAAVTGIDFSTMVQTYFRTMPVAIGSMNMWVAAEGDYYSQTPIRANASAGAGTDTLAQNASGTYFVVPRWTGCPTSCTVANFYLLDATTGAVRSKTDDSNATTSASTDVCRVVSGNMDCSTISNASDEAVTYSITQLDGYAAWGTGSQTFSDVAGNTQVNNGPYKNPNFACAKEPFFIDGNANGVLDCDPTDATKTLASSHDISFSQIWEYQNWYNDVNNTSTLKSNPLIARQNGYQFSDPVAAKKLLTTAFNGWFDGAHTISATTDLNALQVFGLIYLMFSREGGIDMDTDGMSLPGDGRFTVSMPGDTMPEGGGSSMVVNFNHLMGNAFSTFKQ